MPSSPFENLPQPPTLKSLLWVHVELANGERTTLLVARCAQMRVTVPGDRFYSNGVECLVCQGGPAKPGTSPDSVKAVKFVIPCEVVTYVGLGPQVAKVELTGKSDTIVIGPDHSPNRRTMSLEAIRATLRELQEFAEPQ